MTGMLKEAGNWQSKIIIEERDWVIVGGGNKELNDKNNTLLV